MPVFERLLQGWQAQGQQLVTLGDLAAAVEHRFHPAAAPAAEGEVAGRSGLLAVPRQGWSDRPPWPRSPSVTSWCPGPQPCSRRSNTGMSFMRGGAGGDVDLVAVEAAREPSRWAWTFCASRPSMPISSSRVGSVVEKYGGAVKLASSARRVNGPRRADPTPAGCLTWSRPARLPREKAIRRAPCRRGALPKICKCRSTTRAIWRPSRRRRACVRCPASRCSPSCACRPRGRRRAPRAGSRLRASPMSGPGSSAPYISVRSP